MACRIISLTKWLITMVNKSPTYGCGTPCKWPFTLWLINGGYLLTTTYHPLKFEWLDEIRKKHLSPSTSMTFFGSKCEFSRWDDPTQEEEGHPPHSFGYFEVSSMVSKMEAEKTRRIEPTGFLEDGTECTVVPFGKPHEIFSWDP